MKCDISSIELGHRSHLDWKCENRDNLETKFDKVIFPKNKSEICGTFLHEAKTPPKVW